MDHFSWSALSFGPCIVQFSHLLTMNFWVPSLFQEFVEEWELFYVFFTLSLRISGIDQGFWHIYYYFIVEEVELFSYIRELTCVPISIQG
jgi:hypothetical protein